MYQLKNMEAKYTGNVTFVYEGNPVKVDDIDFTDVALMGLNHQFKL